MYKVLSLIIISSLFQQGTNSVSPDGKFKLTVEAKEESDLQTRYITKLTDLSANDTVEIANCIRRDRLAPNYYWNKESKYLIFEQCAESFKDGRIKILNLKSKQVELELIGLIGNRDDNGEQFDFQNDILFYFDTPVDSKSKAPCLSSFNLKTREKKKLFEFKVSFEMEFPEIKRTRGSREITLKYFDIDSQQKTQKIEY
jgi:hypothetical protein